MKKLWILAAGLLFLSSCGGNQNKQETKNDETPTPQTAKKETAVDLTEFKNIKLLAPDTENKAPLMKAMQNRQSQRDYNDKMLSLEDLSNVMWAAYGINRPETGKRTVPSAMAVYPISVYAVLPNGIYAYDSQNNELVAMAEGDYREYAGQDFTHKAPLNIIYMADFGKYAEKYSNMPQDVLLRLAAADASHSSQNVYLYCAAFDMKAVIRGAGMNEPELKKLLKLDDKHHVILGQTVGY